MIVDELPRVAAVKLQLSADPDTAAQQREAAIAALGGEVPVDATDADRDTFHRNRWVFVPPPAGVVTNLPGGAGVLHVGRVFLDSRRRLLVGSNRVAVKLQENLPTDEARAILSGTGLEVVRELRFATNAYQIRVPSERDFLEVAVELQHREHEFEYAEPEMIQYVGRGPAAAAGPQVRTAVAPEQ